MSKTYVPYKVYFDDDSEIISMVSEDDLKEQRKIEFWEKKAMPIVFGIIGTVMLYITVINY